MFIDPECQTAYIRDGEAYTVRANNRAGVYAGWIRFASLAEGNYYMKEFEAPAGYLLDDMVYAITISADYDADSMVTGWHITVKDLNGNEITSVTNTNDTGLYITNTKTGLLPSMDGRGTLIITLIGCAVVAGAAVGVAVSRWKKAT